MRVFPTRTSTLALAAALSLASFGQSRAQVRISSLPAAAALAGSETIPAVQDGSDVGVTPANLLTYITGHITAAAVYGTPTAGHCASWSSATQLQDAGAACGGGSGGLPGGAPGQIQYDNGGAFGGFTVAGDGTLNTSTGALTVTKTNGASFGTAATANTGTSGATLGLLNGALTFGGTLTLANAPILTGNTGYAFANGASAVTFSTTIPLAGLATQAANTVDGNATGSSASPAALGMPSCSLASSALTWTTGGGFGCNTISTGGAVTATGSPASGELASFSGAGSITNGNLSGDCTTANTLAVTCAKTGGTAFGTAATQNTGTSGATIPLLNGVNTWSGATNVFSNTTKFSAPMQGSAGHIFMSNTAPTVGSGFGTSPTVVNNNTAAFAVTEGASGTPSTTGVITLPAATTGWICFANDQTSATITARQSAGASTSATITFSSAPANNDVIVFLCGAY